MAAIPNCAPSRSRPSMSRGTVVHGAQSSYWYGLTCPPGHFERTPTLAYPPCAAIATAAPPGCASSATWAPTGRWADRYTDRYIDRYPDRYIVIRRLHGGRPAGWLMPSGWGAQGTRSSLVAQRQRCLARLRPACHRVKLTCALAHTHSPRWRCAAWCTSCCKPLHVTHRYIPLHAATRYTPLGALPAASPF